MDGISKERFRSIGAVTLIYGAVFTFCLYKNIDGIMTALLAIATVAYILYCAPRLKGYKNEDKFPVWIEPWNRETDELEQEDMQVVPEPMAEKDDVRDVPRSKQEAEQRDAYVAAAKSRYPYYAGIVLLGISTFLTQDSFIIDVNYMGMLLLTFGVLIRIFFSDKEWGFKKYIAVMVEMALSPLMYILRPLQDYQAMRRTEDSRKRKIVGYVIVGAVCAFPVLLVVIALLSSADVIFSRVINYMFGDIRISYDLISSDLIGIVLLFAVVVVYVYGLAVTVTAENIKESVRDTNRLEPVIGITFTTLLTLVYLLYSAIQILQLFVGEHLLPAGYTYSRYAREGFFQLLFVAGLNLLIVLFCISIFRKHKVLDIVLTVMSICTYIMIASSLVRMLLYIKVYNLTYLRILVLLALLMIAFAMAGLIIRIYRTNFPLVHYVILTVGALWIGFSFARPESIIAHYNLEKLRQTEAVQRILADDGKGEHENLFDCRLVMNDLEYLCELGADAAPALYEFFDLMAMDEYCEDGVSEYRRYVPEYLYESYFKGYEDEKVFLRSFNVSKYRAKKYAEQVAETIQPAKP